MKEPVKWLMPAPSAEPRMPRGAIGGPAYFVSKRRAHISGCATTTDPTLNCDGLAQAETRQAFIEKMLSVELLARAAFRQAFHEAHLLARRKALIGTLAKLRREHRATCSAMADLRAVTHELLAMGDR